MLPEIVAAGGLRVVAVEPLPGVQVKCALGTYLDLLVWDVWDVTSGSKSSGPDFLDSRGATETLAVDVVTGALLGVSSIFLTVDSLLLCLVSDSFFSFFGREAVFSFWGSASFFSCLGACSFFSCFGACSFFSCLGACSFFSCLGACSFFSLFLGANLGKSASRTQSFTSPTSSASASCGSSVAHPDITPQEHDTAKSVQQYTICKQPPLSGPAPEYGTGGKKHQLLAP